MYQYPCKEWMRWRLPTEKEYIIAELSIRFRELFDHYFGDWVFTLHNVTRQWSLRKFGSKSLTVKLNGGAPRSCPAKSFSVLPPSLTPGEPKKSPMQSAKLNGPCFSCIVDILSNSVVIEPIAEPTTSLMAINKYEESTQCSYGQVLLTSWEMKVLRPWPCQLTSNGTRTGLGSKENRIGRRRCTYRRNLGCRYSCFRSV